MLHFRFSILYLLKILHQLFDSEEIVALGAVLSDFIGVVVHYITPPSFSCKIIA